MIEYQIWGRDRLEFKPVKMRLKTLGLTDRDIARTINLIVKWLHNNGPIGYLEQITRQGTAWKQVYSGDIQIIPGCSRTRDNIPVRTWYLKRYRVSTVLRVMKFLKNLITFKKVLPSQWSKFYNSATRPRPTKESLLKWAQVTANGASHGQSKDELSWDVPLPITEFVNSRVGNKTFSPFDTRTSVPRQPFDVIVDSLKVARHGPYNMRDLLPFIEAPPTLEGPRTAGLIGVTQEPGGKARFFVSVHPAYQSAFVPLQRALKYRAKRDRCSYAFDQEAGRNRVRKALQQGLTVHSFDLSDATNNFPLYLQSSWMYKSMIEPSQIVSFEEISRMPYMVCQEIHDLTGIDTVTFTTGQPLGLLPSAMAFHLTHIYLIRGIEIHLYGRPRNRFAVLVDDVCIWDAEVARLYALALSEMDVPVSKLKTLVSGKAAEFLGRFITSQHVIELTKQSRVSLDNVIHYCRVFGLKALDEMRLGKAKYDALKGIVSLPSALGGSDLGNGLPLIERTCSASVLPWLQAMSDRRKLVSNQYDPIMLTDRVRTLLRLIRENGGKIPPYLSNYLLELLPRFRSQLPAVWYCLPSGKVTRGLEKASYTRQFLATPLNGVLIRKDVDFDEISEISKPESLRQVIADEKTENITALRSFLDAVGATL